MLESVSENLASQSVPGFKKNDIVVGAMDAGMLPKEYRDIAGQGPATYQFPTSNQATNFIQGPIRKTSSNTDLAIDGRGFFTIELPGGREAYTRDGEFKVDKEGTLVSKEGLPVLGEAGPIVVDPMNKSLVTIQPDGTVSQGPLIIGQLKIADFNDTSKLQKISGGLFKTGEDGQGVLGVENPRIRQGYLESSNVSTVKEMAGMILALRNYEANQKVIQNVDDKLGKAIQSIGDSAAR